MEKIAVNQKSKFLSALFIKCMQWNDGDGMLNKINIFLVILLAGFIIFAVFQIFRIAEEKQNHKKLANNYQSLPL